MIACTPGTSTGAMLRHRSQLANIQAWHGTADDHLHLTLPLFHVHKLMI